MDDTISRQAAIAALNEYFARIEKLKRRGLTKGEKAISLDTVGAIKTLPPAEPKRGKWNRLDMDTFNCNQCGTTFVLNQGSEKMHFCPNCGADMRGEQDG